MITEQEYEKLSDEEKLTVRGEGVPFERIRRVTGYLNQDYRRWNNGKQAELRDRVKHSINR